MPIRARHESEKQLELSKIGYPYLAQGILLSPCDIWIGRLDILWSFNSSIWEAHYWTPLYDI